ncbi:ankyrin repeat domain-containing protein [Kitasatospora sp. NPDC004531]
MSDAIEPTDHDHDGSRYPWPTAPLERAVLDGCAEHVAAELRAGERPHQPAGEWRELTLLCQALTRGHTEVARLLLAAGAPVGPQARGDMYLPLSLAETPELVDLLMEYGAEVDDRRVHGVSAVEWAAARLDARTVRHLLIRGAVPTPNAYARACSAVARAPERAAAFEEVREAIGWGAFLRHHWPATGGRPSSPTAGSGR